MNLVHDFQMFLRSSLINLFIYLFICFFDQVDSNNLGEYISLVVDATVNSGIMCQVEAFRAGFNQVSNFYFSCPFCMQVS